jgi:hypothetical protein
MFMRGDLITLLDSREMSLSSNSARTRMLPALISGGWN